LKFGIINKLHDLIHSIIYELIIIKSPLIANENSYL
jgi:hypothetical protein